MGRKTLGILGGMGAKAGASFYNRLVDLTPAEKDQEHIEAVLYSNPSIPDRTEGILETGTDPYPALLSSARLVEEAGADLLVIACISAHYYIPRLRSELDCEILSAVEETSETIKKECSGNCPVGLLATTGTIRSELFQSALDDRPVITLPDKLQEELVMGAIYGELKAGRIAKGREKANEALRIITDMGAGAVVIGCSELPLVIDPACVDIRIFDSMEILIRRAVSLCLG